MQAQAHNLTEDLNHSMQNRKYYQVLAAFLMFLFIFFVAMQDFAAAEASTVAQLEKKSEQGDAEAQVSLGAKYYEGEGVKQDYKKAKYYFELAAAQDDADAQRML